MSASEYQPDPERTEKRPATSDIAELAPNVLRSELPIELPGLGHVNCYMLQDSDGVALVDPGLPGETAWAALVDRLKLAHYKVRDVHTVIITHSHFDHYGGADRLREESGARIVAHHTLNHPGNRPDIDDVVEFLDPAEAAELHREPLNEFGRWSPWGTWTEAPAHVIERWRALGVDRRTLEAPAHDVGLHHEDEIMLAGRPGVAVHTPGHTSDHLCLYDAEEGLMITGDHVLPTITPHISGFAAKQQPLRHFYDSLRRMHSYDDVALALPAHGDPFTDLYGRADAICDHHDERLDEVRDLRTQFDRGTVTDYMQAMFRERSWGDMAASETYAHLDHLRAAGELSANWVDGELRFA